MQGHILKCIHIVPHFLEENVVSNEGESEK